MENTNVKLSFKERLAYFFGDFGHMGLMCNFVNTYILFFFTDIMGISSAAAGVLLLVATIFNALLNPIYGWFCDRMRTKWGTYRPILIGIALPTGLLTALCFIAPDFTGGGKLAYAYIVYILYCVTNSVSSCAYGSLASVMTTNDHEHVVLGSFREYGMNSGGFILSLVATTLLLFFSRNSEVITEGGIRTMAFLVGAVTFVTLLACGIGCKERVQPKSETVNMGQSLKSVAHNKPAIILMLIVLCVNGLLTFKSVLTTYYCQYYLEDLKMMTPIMTMMFVAPLVGLLFVPKLVDIMGKKRMFILSGIIAVAAGALLLIARGGIVLNCVSSLLCGVVCAFAFATLWGTIPDCAQYGLEKSGVFCPGMIISGMSFAIAVSVALAQYGSSLLLSIVGYDPSLAVQSASTVHAIYLFSGLIPVIFGILTVVFALFFSLEKKAVKE